MRRSRLHAHGQLRRRPCAPGVPRSRGRQPGKRLPRARHLARGRHHDAAGGGRPFLGPRHHADDPDRDREWRGRGLRRLAHLLSLRGRVRPRDHSDRRRALPDLVAVRPRRRPGATGLPRTPPRSMTMRRNWNEGAMLTRRQALAATALAALFVAASARAQDRLKVIASFSILGDLVKNVGGDRVEVATLVGPNGNAHVYAPSPGDAKKVADAKLVFVNGLGFEGWLERLVKASGTKAPIAVATKGIKPLERAGEHGHDHDHGRADPHAWQSVANAKIYVANIRDALIAADPAGKSAYEANAAAYLGKLDALDQEVRAAVAAIPADRRRVISTHDAFGYFQQAYGIEFIAPQGVSTEAEPSARDVARIITQVKKQKIPAVFLENIADARLMERIAQETGARIGGKLYSDALTGDLGDATSYIDLIRHNMKQLTVA